MQRESAGSFLGANSRVMDDDVGPPDMWYCTSAKNRKRRPREDVFLVVVAREGISLRESADRFELRISTDSLWCESCYPTRRIPGY